ncbi:unnamed protein product [Colias eurytheme]|nr:unnamed protein product [Colias eurytheme]
MRNKKQLRYFEAILKQESEQEESMNRDASKFESSRTWRTQQRHSSTRDDAQSTTEDVEVRRSVRSEVVGDWRSEEWNGMRQ